MSTTPAYIKTATIILAIICIIISLLPINPYLVGIYPHCGLIQRLSYSFFHASLIHAAINTWCILSIVFIYDINIYYIVIAYLTAITFPVEFSAILLSSLPFPASCGSAAVSILPTIGLSSICFSLLGMVSWQAKRKAYYHTWVVSLIFAGFLIPHLCLLCGYSIATPNNILHAYSYLVGLFVGFLNSPLPCRK